MFLRSINMTALVPINTVLGVLWGEWYIKLAASCNRKCILTNVCLSLYTQGNEISTAICFRDLAILLHLIVRILSYFRVSGISKMVACNRKWVLIYHKFTANPDVEEYSD